MEMARRRLQVYNACTPISINDLGSIFGTEFLCCGCYHPTRGLSSVTSYDMALFWATVGNCIKYLSVSRVTGVFCNFPTPYRKEKVRRVDMDSLII
jgi:hypothetical protein